MSDSNAAVEGVAGAIGGCIAIFCTFPLQTIATRQAVSNRKDTKEDAEEQRQNSLATYYHGIYPSLLGTVTSSGIYFYVYSVLRQLVQGKTKDGVVAPLSVAQSLVVASLAGSVNVLCTNPVWVAVTRMQTASKNAQKVSFFSEISSMYEEGGLKGLWRGTIPSLIMVSNPTIQYMLYEWGAQWWRRPGKGRTTAGGSLTSLEVFFISAMAKLGATLCTYPLLVVKNRVQAAKRNEQNPHAESHSLAIIQQVWDQEGAFGFFKGMRPRIVQSVLGASIMFVLKERLHSTAMHIVTARK